MQIAAWFRRPVDMVLRDGHSSYTYQSKIVPHLHHPSPSLPRLPLIDIYKTSEHFTPRLKNGG